MMTDTEHNELVKLAESGKIIIGVDRTAARKLFTDVPLSTIQEKTGEIPYFEKSLLMSVFIFGPVSLITSVVLAFIAFGWWGLIPLLLCPMVYFLYQSSSSIGETGLSLITAFAVATSLVHFSENFNAPWFTGFAAIFLFSLWCVRLVYVGAAFLYRAFVIRNRKAFEFLSPGLSITHIE